MNQQNHHEDNIQIESLTDLELTPEQSEATKAGFVSPFGNFQGGVHVG